LYQKQGDLMQGQQDFISKEIMNGLPNKTGTKSKIIYLNNNNVIELIEAILHSKSTNQIVARYEIST